MLALAVFTTYVVMDTFVITRVYGDASGIGTGSVLQTEGNSDNAAQAQEEQAEDSDADASEGGHAHGGPPSGGKGPGGKHGKSESGSDSSSSSDSGISTAGTADSYSDENISIGLKEYTVSGTVVHVAEVKADSAEYLKTAFAQGSYGKNVTATTSDTAESVNAILAINGDYYGAQEKGYVIRNGKLYRNTAVSGRADLVIYEDGSFEIIT